MKPIRLLVLAGFAAVFALSAGCVSRTVEAASTRLEVTTEEGKTVSVVFPKEFHGEAIALEIDPASGVYRFTAAKLTTASSPVIDAAGNANAQTITALAGAVQSLSAAALSTAAKGAGAP
jgi:hypothetical protein